MDIGSNNPRNKTRSANIMLHNVSLHPAAQIVIWICLAVLLQGLQDAALIALAAALLAVAMLIGASRFFALLRRMRWVLISLLLIYGYVTPGLPCWVQLGVFSPSCEGLMSGGLQLIRLLTMLAGLAILFARLSTTQMMSGIYTLTYSLRYLGVSPERVTVRIALTLGYAEEAMHNTASNWRAGINTMIYPQPSESGSIELQLSTFTLGDWLAIIAASALVLGVLI